MIAATAAPLNTCGAVTPAVTSRPYREPEGASPALPTSSTTNALRSTLRRRCKMIRNPEPAHPQQARSWLRPLNCFPPDVERDGLMPDAAHRPPSQLATGPHGPSIVASSFRRLATRMCSVGRKRTQWASPLAMRNKNPPCQRRMVAPLPACRMQPNAPSSSSRRNGSHLFPQSTVAQPSARDGLGRPRAVPVPCRVTDPLAHSLYLSQLTIRRHRISRSITPILTPEPCR